MGSEPRVGRTSKRTQERNAVNDEVARGQRLGRHWETNEKEMSDLRQVGRVLWVSPPERGFLLASTQLPRDSPEFESTSPTHSSYTILELENSYEP